MGILLAILTSVVGHVSDVVLALYASLSSRVGATKLLKRVTLSECPHVAGRSVVIISVYVVDCVFYADVAAHNVVKLLFVLVVMGQSQVDLQPAHLHPSQQLLFIPQSVFPQKPNQNVLVLIQPQGNAEL